MDFRIVISDPTSGRAHQIELKDPSSSKFVGKRIGDRISGDVLGLPGYAVQITGGSDREGFPMRADLPGTKRRRLLVAGGTGYHADALGKKKRKSIHGREISSDIGQINVKIVESGSKPLGELLGVAPKEEKK
ncbi:MAG: 30S ribosomal protein S6e [Methanotrichaceae archaeon]|nr:30S ribosomal protein S6e [Methanotrichaceae archaeon]